MKTLVCILICAACTLSNVFGQRAITFWQDQPCTITVQPSEPQVCGATLSPISTPEFSFMDDPQTQHMIAKLYVSMLFNCLGYEVVNVVPGRYVRKYVSSDTSKAPLQNVAPYSKNLPVWFKTQI